MIKWTLVASGELECIRTPGEWARAEQPHLHSYMSQAGKSKKQLGFTTSRYADSWNFFQGTIACLPPLHQI